MKQLPREVKFIPGSRVERMEVPDHLGSPSLLLVPFHQQSAFSQSIWNCHSEPIPLCNTLEGTNCYAYCRHPYILKSVGLMYVNARLQRSRCSECHFTSYAELHKSRIYTVHEYFPTFVIDFTTVYSHNVLRARLLRQHHDDMRWGLEPQE